MDGQDEKATSDTSAAPLRTLLEALSLPDFTDLTSSKGAPKRQPGEVPGETTVTGFVCQSDPAAARWALPCTGQLSRGDR